MSNAKVELFDVALKGCGYSGLRITRSCSSETTVVATRCEFANSSWEEEDDDVVTSAGMVAWWVH